MPNRAFLADTTALLVFFTAVGIANESLVAGMAWEEIATSRLIGAAVMLPTARPYGLWRDLLMQRAGPGVLSRTLWDSLALVSFQVPIYAAIIGVSGATGWGFLGALVSFTALMLVLGRPYGWFLGRVRALYGLAPAPCGA